MMRRQFGVQDSKAAKRQSVDLAVRAGGLPVHEGHGTLLLLCLKSTHLGQRLALFEKDTTHICNTNCPIMQIYCLETEYVTPRAAMKH